MTDLAPLARSLIDALVARNAMLATAESCTGGMIAAAITAIPGSSAALERGVVTYSNAAKSSLLSVPEALIARHGAVSAEVAEAMARGALAQAPVVLALSVTGIAGPGGGSADKPVGLVYLGWAWKADAEPHATVERHVFPGDRAAIRLASAARALTRAAVLTEAL